MYVCVKLCTVSSFHFCFSCLSLVRYYNYCCYYYCFYCFFLHWFWYFLLIFSHYNTVQVKKKKSINKNTRTLVKGQQQHKQVWFKNCIIVRSSAYLSVDSTATPTPLLSLESSILLVFDKSNVEQVQSSHLPLSPRVSPTGRLEGDCQLICRTTHNHLQPLLLHTSTHEQVNNTHTHSQSDVGWMNCSAADLSSLLCVCICWRRRSCIKTYLIGPV